MGMDNRGYDARLFFWVPDGFWTVWYLLSLGGVQGLFPVFREG